MLAAHEALAGGLIGGAGALFAAWIAFTAVQEQLAEERLRTIPRITVTCDYFATIEYGGGEPFLLLYRAINLGERDVALKTFLVEVLSEKNNFFRHMLNNMTGRRLRRALRMLTPMGIIKSEPTLPLLLQPGRECVLIVDQTQLLAFMAKTAEWAAHVHGVFEDETGREYKSPPATVDWQKRTIT